MYFEPPLRLAILVCVAASAAATRAHALTYPADSGVIDLTLPPYSATPNDDTDDTQAINRALEDHANGNRVLFLPPGTYRVSDTLRWGQGDKGGHEQKRTTLEGAGQDKTVLQLVDAAPGFTDPAAPKSVIWTGQKPAQRFRNGIRHLTVDTGNNNPGAIGIQYIASNQGSMRHVTIRSGSPDKAGVIGLDLGYTDEQGPCLIESVTVEGFDVGVSTRTIVASITLDNITLNNQRVVGFRNDGQIVSVRRLKVSGAPIALENKGVNSLLTLIDSELIGANATGPAVVSSGAVFARDLRVSGFALGIQNDAEQGTKQNAPAGTIEEFVSHAPRFAFENSRKTSLRLPVKEFPQVVNVPVDQWISAAAFKADPTDKLDDTAAIQQAIDASDGSTLYFPRAADPEARSHAFTIEGELKIPGKITRITALEGFVNGNGTIRIIDDGTTAPIVIDRIDLTYRKLNIVNESDRPLLLQNITSWGNIQMKPKGPDLFLDDVCVHKFEFDHINVFARQLNPEARERKLLNQGGNLWILGLKTEQAGTIVETTDGGSTEILGGFIYAQGAEKTTPMFIVDNARMTATVGETTWNKRNFKTVLDETRGTVNKQFLYDKTAYWRNNHASMLPLLIAAE
jgi:Pectate lyase superfamily protein